MDAVTGRIAPGTTMNAAVLDRFGGIDELTVRRIAVPRVGDDDVLIRVESAGVGAWDAVEREGAYDGAFGVASTFPYVLGWDGAGRVAAVGRNVTRFALGDRVYAASMPLPRGGFYAEYAVVEAEHAARVPDKLPIRQAGALAWDALTALSGLEVLNLQQNQSLMIVGASGGIGHMALQLARHMNIRVLAVASGEDGVALAQRLGANATVDGHRDDVEAAARKFTPTGLDAALVTVGGTAVERALGSMKSGGRVACPNGVLPLPATPDGVQMMLYDGNRSRSATDKLNSLIDSGPFEVQVAKTFPLTEITEAHRFLSTHYVGKLSLELPAPTARE